jgi:hypothetical protein
MMRQADPVRPSIVSADGINQAATQQNQAVDIATILPSDRFRVVSGK